MAELLTFHFEGAQADDHRMNFYESARFQYAAARLLVKLAQFREKGQFVRNISNKSNLNVKLVSQSDGSFNFNIEEPHQDDQESFVKISLSDLIAYVAERVVEKIEFDALTELVIAESGRVEFDEDNTDLDSIDDMAESVIDGQSMTASLPVETREIIKRRVAEIYRERRLVVSAHAIEAISEDQEQKLVAMAAPLFVEMGTALRKSANTLEVTSGTNGQSQSVLFLDRTMARDIETAVVDRKITPILGDVAQFNKENGWGKLRIESGARTLSFSIPSDVLPQIRQQLIDSMKKDLVYLQTYFVRDRAKDIKRLIVVGILKTPSV